YLYRPSRGPAGPWSVLSSFPGSPTCTHVSAPGLQHVGVGSRPPAARLGRRVACAADGCLGEHTRWLPGLDRVPGTDCGWARTRMVFWPGTAELVFSPALFYPHRGLLVGHFGEPLWLPPACSPVRIP